LVGLQYSRDIFLTVQQQPAWGLLHTEVCSMGEPSFSMNKLDLHSVHTWARRPQELAKVPVYPETLLFSWHPLGR